MLTSLLEQHMNTICFGNDDGIGPAAELPVLEGIAYLQRMDESHMCGSVAAPSADKPTCGRISCSLDTAIWNCNYNDHYVSHPCRIFGDYANDIYQKCTNWQLPMGWCTWGHNIDVDLGIGASIGQLDGHC